MVGLVSQSSAPVSRIKYLEESLAVVEITSESLDFVRLANGCGYPTFATMTMHNKSSEIFSFQLSLEIILTEH